MRRFTFLRVSDRHRVEKVVLCNLSRDDALVQTEALDTAERPEEGVTMKAIRLHARGGPEQLEYEESPLPSPGDGEAQIRVFASGINPTELIWSATYQTADGRDRLPSIPGHDVSGVVEALGSDVRDLSIGEAVYGLTEFPRDGSAAEYVVVRASGLAPKPVTLDHVNAAAVPLSALTAWQALFVHGDLLPGQRVLIHGAAGGVGSFAVQLARWRGAEVSGTASARHNQFLRRLGVETLINYQSTRFEEILKDVDLVLDTIGGEVLDRSWRVLRRGGSSSPSRRSLPRSKPTLSTSGVSTSSYSPTGDSSKRSAGSSMLVSFGPS